MVKQILEDEKKGNNGDHLSSTLKEYSKIILKFHQTMLCESGKTL